MDAVEFLKEKNRMCREYSDLPEDCLICPIGNGNGGCQAGILGNQKVTEEMLVQIVEKWAKEHPIKTRQSEFLKMFPNASMVDGVPELNPCHVDNKFSPQKGCGNSSCAECRKEYWNEEIER